MYNSLYEVINSFEIRGKEVRFNSEKLTLNVWDSQSDYFIKVKIIALNENDVYSSLVQLEF
ncbi:MAG: hypothetical protein ACRC0G_01615 [Fusobacteriaceae bacterium]